MEEDGPYFSAVMSSPSDDGQYTDTDKEVESPPVVEGTTAEADSAEKSAEQRTSSHGDALSWNEGLSDGERETVELSDGERDEPSDSERPRGSDGQRPPSEGSLQEDEEMRLRRKLLEKRGVAQPMDSVNDESSSTREERVAGKEGGTRNNERDLPMETPSDDEEMFSMQPKDVVKSHKERSRSARLHAERGRDRVEMERFRRREERDREERRRHKLKKKEKEQERVKERGRDKYKRDSDPREERSRHSSAKQTGVVRERDFGRLAGRVTVPESRGKMPPSETRGKMPQSDSRGKTSSRSQEDKVRKERVKESDSRMERTSKETLRVRSPRKRDASPPGAKSRSSKEGFPAKRERREQPPKIEVRGPSEEPQETKEESEGTKEEPEKTKEEMKAEAIDLDTDDVNDVVKPDEDSEEDDDATPKLEHHGSPSGPSKYSKFDSSPEEVPKEEEDVQDIKPVPLSSASDSEAESDVIMRVTDDELEVMAEEDIDEEKLSQLSPDTRARIEGEQQRRLIAQLPVFYPGISGCRNVAEFECLNRIEEGTFGVVYRAKEKRSDLVVALKRLKMEKEREGFPITSLREINMLLKAGNHPNIVNVREIVIGSTMDKIYLVMEYVEHDMKSLMDMMHSRGKHFTIGQVKTLLHQLLSGVAHMHDEWILHRDLKTSNLLLSHKGILKIGDFGLAREFGDPLQAYTPIVVTLWYRSPELLLGVKEYSTAVDMWSCGCIFAEFLRLKPLFPGKGELDEINKIFLELGTPSDKIWPGYSQLPGPRKMKFEHHEFNQLWKKFPTNVVDKKGLEFLNELLRYDPAKRLSAHEALVHEWFDDEPHPTPPELFPTWPAKSELGKAVTKSPITKPPSNAKDLHDQKLYRELKVEPPQKASATGFALKFDAVKFGD